jgi:hypothetical protein
MYSTILTGVVGTRIHTGTANQINIANGSGASGNPTYSLSSTLDLPGTFNIQSTIAIDSIINDTTMSTATATNISTSAAIKSYVDSLVTGLNIQGSCVAGTTGALTANYSNGASGVGATLTNAGAQAVFTIDGVSPTLGQRVLIKDQASSLQNGIYTVTDVGSGATDWVLTRATDYDTPADITPGDLVILTGGTLQAQSSWAQTSTVVTIGVSAITWVQFTASLPVNVASGGTGRTSATAYAPIVGGTTTTSAFQSVTLGAAGTLFQSAGVGALPGFTTTTYPTTNAINTIMYASSANVLGVVTPTNNGVLVYSVGGVPSSSTTLPSALTIPLPRINGINDSNGNEIFTFASTASAVNYINLVNSATGVNPSYQAAGDDTNIGLIFLTKGTGQINLNAANTTTPLLINSGTGLQHSTSFIFANTAGSRNVTFPDASGTLAFSSTVFNQKSVQVFTSGSAAYTPSSGTLYCDVYVTAGGGGGGGAAAGAAPQAAAAGGGGAGGTSILFGVAVATISGQTVTVGAGGNGGTAGNNTGSTGNASSVGAVITTTGGGGGSGGQSFSAAGAPRIGGGGGSAGSGGSVNIPGGAGGFGVANGVSTILCSGVGGSSFWGGGALSINTSAVGLNSSVAGSGGSGAGATVTTDRAGGNGAAGLVVIVEYKGV